MDIFKCKEKVGKDKFVLNKLALNNKIVELESIIEKNQIGLDYEKLKSELIFGMFDFLRTSILSCQV